MALDASGNLIVVGQIVIGTNQYEAARLTPKTPNGSLDETFADGYLDVRTLPTGSRDTKIKSTEACEPLPPFYGVGRVWVRAKNRMDGDGRQVNIIIIYYSQMF